MARSKPYTKKLLAMDIALSLCTGFVWTFFVMPFRELYRFGQTTVAPKTN